MKAGKTIIGTALLIANGMILPAMADDIGSGSGDPDAAPTPPGTTGESCTSALDCVWQELLELFDMDVER